MHVPVTNNYVAEGYIHHNSGKSLPAAHLAIRHCLDNPNTCGLIGRQSLKDLKNTLFKKIRQHLKGAIKQDGTPLVENRDYWVNRTTASFRFANGSEIIGYSWSDKDWESFGSLELSFFIIEEATENDNSYKDAYFRLLTRCGRLPHIAENWGMLLCNPDGPDHWIYEHFGLVDDEHEVEPPIDRGFDPLKHVYYSNTDDNKFLPDWYIPNLLKNMDPITAERLLRGRWVHHVGNYIYFAYNRRRQFKKEISYEFDESLPIDIAWDFNIGVGKPMSAMAGQFLPNRDEYHIGREFVIEGMRTENSCEEIADSGLLEYPVKFRLFGDATGKARSTNSNHSDWEIIERFFANYRTKDGKPLDFEIQVPTSNPPRRDRQNLVNGYCYNYLKKTRLFIYKDAPTADKGLRFTKPKKGAKFDEDDSDPWQHITTAIGYWIFANNILNERPEQRSTVV